MRLRQIFPLKSVGVFVLALSVPLAGCAKSILPQLPDEPESEAQGAEHTDVASEFTPPSVQTMAVKLSANQKLQVLEKYSYLDPKHQVNDKILAEALLYFDANASSFQNKNYLTIVDFSKRSSDARFFIIDMVSGAVWAMHVAHGSGSDANNDGYAESFSNVSNSQKSSLGVYRTAETYAGKHGNSMRMDGLSSSNSNVRSRAIVIHAANYVQEASVIQGRSWGCFALATANRDGVIARLKGGSMIYAGLE